MPASPELMKLLDLYFADRTVRFFFAFSLPARPQLSKASLLACVVLCHTGAARMLPLLRAWRRSPTRVFCGFFCRDSPTMHSTAPVALSSPTLRCTARHVGAYPSQHVPCHLPHLSL